MAHFDRILRGGAVVDPVNGLAGETMDIALKDGRVAEVAPHVEGSADEVEDLTGLTVMPGLIDPHLHLGTSFGSPYGTRMAALAGVIFCLAAFVGIIFVVVRALIFGDPTAGWPSMVCIMLLCSGVQLFCLGIVGEYLAKTYLEVKHRPIYITRETEQDRDERKPAQQK